MRKEPAQKGVIKWLVGLLLLGGIIGGCFLVYRWWTKPTPEKIEQNNKHKEIFNKQIQEIKSLIDKNRTSLEKAKKGEEHPPWETFDEFEKHPPFDPAEKELVELYNEKARLSKVWNELIREWVEWVQDRPHEQNKSLWERQKNGQWKMLTERLDKSPDVKVRFDKLIREFYRRFGEKKGIKIHESRIDFHGFGHFYFEEMELNSRSCEMGRTWYPAGKQIELINGKVTYFPIIIDLNQIYLLNHGTIGMDKFFPQKPAPGDLGFSIDFDHLINTIAHEIAHALQSIVNVDKGRDSVYEKDKKVYTQCESSGERGANKNLLHPDWVAEHDKFTKEVEQMIKQSSEYQELEKWWKSSN